MRIRARASYYSGVRLLGAMGGLALILATGWLAGCASSGRPASSRTIVVPFTREDMALREKAREARYHLRVGDRLGVEFHYYPKLSQQHVEILPDGTISLARVGVVPAAGFTIEQLDSLITARVGDELRDPDLSVVVESLAAYQVYVLGQVNKPGLYNIPPQGQGVMQAVALAGGFAEGAAASETVVMRVTDEGLAYIHVDLSHLEKNRGMPAAGLVLRPYDVIYVPKSAIGDLAYFTKNILRPVLDFSNLYWDIYAVTNIDKVDRIVR